jgi:hypothetical protein
LGFKKKALGISHKAKEKNAIAYSLLAIALNYVTLAL